MDNECGAIIIEYVNDLGVSPIGGLSDDQPLAIANGFGIRGACVINNIFRIGCRHSVFGDVLFVPIVPSIAHLE